MTALTDTQVITASGGLVELGYSQITSAVSITNGTYGTGTEVIAPLTVVCDGGPVLVEFFSQNVYLYTPPVIGDVVDVALWQDGAEHTRYWGRRQADTAQPTGGAMSLKYRVTPSAGTHTFGVKAVNSAGATRPGGVNAGVGGASVAPAFLRVSKIVQATQWPAVTTGTIICTSSTRPSAPFTGQKIYETDTKKELTYDGASWTQPWNQPWGVVGIGTHDTGAQVAANTSFCSVTFTPVLNRYYQAFYTSRTIWTTAGTIGIFDSVANGRIAEQYGAPDPVTLQRTKTFSSTASRTLSIRTDGVQTPISGSYSPHERPAQLVVMDVGPA